MGSLKRELFPRGAQQESEGAKVGSPFLMKECVIEISM
jgi:hypothetical protein